MIEVKSVNIDDGAISHFGIIAPKTKKAAPKGGLSSRANSVGWIATIYLLFKNMQYQCIHTPQDIPIFQSSAKIRSASIDHKWSIAQRVDVLATKYSSRNFGILEASPD
jgi:hypothetical protein